MADYINERYLLDRVMHGFTDKHKSVSDYRIVGRFDLMFTIHLHNSLTDVHLHRFLLKHVQER